MSDRLWMAALPNTLLEPLVHPSRQITATIYLFQKHWAVEVWTGWFVVHENATFRPKIEKKEKEMIQAPWWKTLAGPDGASNYLHYQNKAITPSGQVRVPPQVIILTSDPAGKNSGYAAMAAAADRTDVDHRENSQMRVWWAGGGKEGGNGSECRSEGSGLSQESRRGRSNNVRAVLNQYWTKSAKITLKLIGWYIFIFFIWLPI